MVRESPPAQEGSCPIANVNSICQVGSTIAHPFEARELGPHAGDEVPVGGGRQQQHVHGLQRLVMAPQILESRRVEDHLVG
jgi:hypothetical protein